MVSSKLRQPPSLRCPTQTRTLRPTQSIPKILGLGLDLVVGFLSTFTGCNADPLTILYRFGFRFLSQDRFQGSKLYKMERRGRNDFDENTAFCPATRNSIFAARAGRLMENEAIFNGDCIFAWRSIENESPSFFRFVLRCVMDFAGNGQMHTQPSERNGKSCGGEFIFRGKILPCNTTDN